MMKIVVLSDTHSRTVPTQVKKALEKADLVIHAGDISDVKMLEELESINDIEAVSGNMDDAILRKKLSRRLILKCEGVRIGVFHGEGSPEGMLNRIEKEFETEDVDVIVFGHSHAPLNKRMKDILFFNPGSPNDDIFAPYCSYGILEIEGNSIKANIIKVE